MLLHTICVSDNLILLMSFTIKLNNDDDDHGYENDTQSSKTHPRKRFNQPWQHCSLSFLRQPAFSPASAKLCTELRHTVMISLISKTFG